MATHTLMTAEQFDELNRKDDRDLELLDGELIEMPSANPQHNEILGNVVAAIRPFMRQHRLGTVVPETDFAFGEHRVRPDIVIFVAEKWARVDPLKLPVQVVPDVVVEIVSPFESARNLDRKIALYRQHGVAESWAFYPALRHMYVHSAAGIRELHDTDTLTCSVLPGWSVPLSEIFD